MKKTLTTLACLAISAQAWAHDYRHDHPACPQRWCETPEETRQRLGKSHPLNCYTRDDCHFWSYTNPEDGYLGDGQECMCPNLDTEGEIGIAENYRYRPILKFYSERRMPEGCVIWFDGCNVHFKIEGSEYGFAKTAERCVEKHVVKCMEPVE